MGLILILSIKRVQKTSHLKWHNMWIKLCNVFHARRNYCNSSHKLGCCALSLIIHHCDVQLDWQGMSNAHPYNPPHFNFNVKTGTGEKFTIREIINSFFLVTTRDFCMQRFWVEIFRKQIDKLQTNHRGVFVLKDFDLKWLRRLPPDDECARVAAIKLLAFPCGYTPL